MSSGERQRGANVALFRVLCLELKALGGTDAGWLPLSLLSSVGVSIPNLHPCRLFRTVSGRRIIALLYSFTHTTIAYILVLERIVFHKTPAEFVLYL